MHGTTGFQERISAVQACLSFALSYPEVDRVVVGVETVSQLTQLISAARSPLDIDFLDISNTDERLINPSLVFSMKVVALVQARMSSTRMPNKVMKLINGVPMIELLLSRLSNSRRIDEIVLATSVDRRNGPLVEHVRSLGYACEQGSENDVLDRYVQAASKHDADVVVRITGDCPLVDPELVDACIGKFFDSNAEYCSNTIRQPTLMASISR